MRPIRKLTDEAQLGAWHRSEAQAKLLSFVQTISKVVEGHTTTDSCSQSEVGVAVVDSQHGLERSGAP